MGENLKAVVVHIMKITMLYKKRNEPGGDFVIVNNQTFSSVTLYHEFL